MALINSPALISGFYLLIIGLIIGIVITPTTPIEGHYMNTLSENAPGNAPGVDAKATQANNATQAAGEAAAPSQAAGEGAAPSQATQAAGEGAAPSQATQAAGEGAAPSLPPSMIECPAIPEGDTGTAGCELVATDADVIIVPDDAAEAYNAGLAHGNKLLAKERRDARRAKARAQRQPLGEQLEIPPRK